MFNTRTTVVVLVVMVIVLGIVLVSFAGPMALNALMKMHTGN